jgi:hypothetical protein
MSSIILQGRPGSGKTTLAATLRKVKLPDGRPLIPLFLDLDKKIPEMESMRQLLEEGLIQVWTPRKGLSEALLSQLAHEPMKTAPKVQPQGYLEIAEKIDQLRDQPPEDFEQVVPILDSATRLDDHLRTLIKYFVKKGGGAKEPGKKKAGGEGDADRLGFDGYEALLDNYTTFYDEFFNSLKKVGYPHRLVTMHVKEDWNKEREEWDKRPLLTGQYRERIAGMTDETYICQIYQPSESMDPQYQVLTSPVRGYKHARTSRGLKTIEKADFENLFASKEVTSE